MNKNTFLHLFTVLGLCLLLSPISASATFFYFDTERSDEQTFTASELVMEANLSTQTVVLTGESTPTEFIATVDTSTASVDSAYDLVVTSTAGNAAFCAALQLTAQSPTGFTSSALTGFVMNPATVLGDTELQVSLDPGAGIAAGQTCDVTVTVTAWQANMDKATAGYRDSVQRVFTVVAPAVVQPTAGVFGFVSGASSNVVAPEDTTTTEDTTDPTDIPATPPQEPAEPAPAPETKPDEDLETIDVVEPKPDTPAPADGDSNESQQTTEATPVSALKPDEPAESAPEAEVVEPKPEPPTPEVTNTEI